jgi:hypothetical protein
MTGADIDADAALHLARLRVALAEERARRRQEVRAVRALTKIMADVLEELRCPKQQFNDELGLTGTVGEMMELLYADRFDDMLRLMHRVGFANQNKRKNRNGNEMN